MVAPLAPLNPVDAPPLVAYAFGFNPALKAIAMKTTRRVFCLVLLVAIAAFWQFTYHKPPQAVLDVLNVPPTPQGSLNPTRTYMLLMQGVRYPAIADLSQPMLRLAGLRINPRTNGPHMPPRIVSLTLKKLPDGGPTSAKNGQMWGTNSEIAIKLPPSAYLSGPNWSPDGTKFATASLDNTAALWDVASGRGLHELTGHNQPVVRASFSRDGRPLATASWDRTARL